MGKTHKKHSTLATVAADGSLKPDEPLPLSAGRVELIVHTSSPDEMELTIRPLKVEAKLDIWTVIGRSRVERSKEDIDEQIRQLRDEWGE